MVRPIVSIKIIRRKLNLEEDTNLERIQQKIDYPQDHILYVFLEEPYDNLYFSKASWKARELMPWYRLYGDLLTRDPWLIQHYAWCSDLPQKRSDATKISSVTRTLTDQDIIRFENVMVIPQLLYEDIVCRTHYETSHVSRKKLSRQLEQVIFGRVCRAKQSKGYQHARFAERDASTKTASDLFWENKVSSIVSMDQFKFGKTKSRTRD